MIRKNTKNAMAITIAFIAVVIMLVGTAISYYIATQIEGKFVLDLFVLPEFISVLSGMILLAFSEIIQILHDTRENSDEVENSLADIIEENVEIIKILSEIRENTSKKIEN